MPSPLRFFDSRAVAVSRIGSKKACLNEFA